MDAGLLVTASAGMTSFTVFLPRHPRSCSHIESGDPARIKVAGIELEKVIRVQELGSKEGGNALPRYA